MSLYERVFFLITQNLTPRTGRFFCPQIFIGYISTLSLSLVETRKTEVSVTEKNLLNIYNGSKDTPF